MIDLKEKLQVFYYHYIYTPIYDFIENISNLIYWIPKVWHDNECFDFGSVYYLLYYKLKHMEKFYKNNNTSINHLKITNEIMIAKNLAKRLNEDDYINNASIEYDKKWEDKGLFNFIPCKYDKNGKIIAYTSVDRNKEQSRDFDNCYKLSNYLEKQDREYLFKYLTRNIRKWY